MLRRGKEHNVSRCFLKIESIIVIKGDLSSPVTMFKLTPLQTEIKEVYAFYLFQFKGHLGFFYLPSFFTTNITNVAIFINAAFDIFQQSLPLTFVTILKNICFQIKNLIERQQSIFDRHETNAYTLNGMTTEQLQICNSSKCHLHTKVNKIYRLIHQIFSLEFTISEMHVQQCSMRI